MIPNFNEELWKIIMNDKRPDNVVASLMRKYEVGELTADQTIKALSIVAYKRLDMIGFIADQCYDFIDDEQEPTGRDLI